MKTKRNQMKNEKNEFINCRLSSDGKITKASSKRDAAAGAAVNG